MKYRVYDRESGEMMAEIEADDVWMAALKARKLGIRGSKYRFAEVAAPDGAEEEKMKKIIERRALDETPFDMVFGGESCHATGDEVCFEGDDPKQPASWWNEYQDSEGNLWYGR